MNWNLSDTQKQSITPLLDKLEQMDPIFPLEQMARLVGLAKAHLPAMTTREATILVKALGGINFPHADILPTTSLADLIASEVSSSLPEDTDADSLRLKYEESADDPEWVKHYKEMPEVRFAESLRALNSLKAYLLIVMVECFWHCRKHDPEGKPLLAEIFNIRDTPEVL